MTWHLFFGLAMGLLSFIGLAMAASAVDDIFQAAGLLLFAFGVLNVFYVINRAVGRRSAAHGHAEPADGAEAS